MGKMIYPVDVFFVLGITMFSFFISRFSLLRSTLRIFAAASFRPPVISSACVMSLFSASSNVSILELVPVE